MNIVQGIVLFAAAFAEACSAQENGDAQPVTRPLANDTAVYAMMASNAYGSSASRLIFPLAELGWRKVGLDGKPIPDNKNSYSPRTLAGKLVSSLQFDIWESAESKDAVIAFKGTDEKVDWIDSDLAVGISIAYKSAKKLVENYMESNPDRRVTVVGHSLGGGIALSMSVWNGVPAVVFNASPRIYDGLANHDQPADRVVIYQKGDPLEPLRKVHPVFTRKIEARQIYQTSFDYHGENAHRADLIASGLLACADTPELRNLAARMNLPVACNF